MGFEHTPHYKNSVSIVQAISISGTSGTSPVKARDNWECIEESVRAWKDSSLFPDTAGFKLARPYLSVV